MQRSEAKQFRYSVTLTGVLVMCVCLALMCFFGYHHRVSLDTAPGVLVNNLFLPTGTALLLYGLMTEHNWLSRVLSSSVFQLLGRSSYAFYLIHVGIIAKWLTTSISNNGFLLFAMLQVTAWILFVAIERPLNLMLRRSLPNQ
jgi:peptidoglycan/LPS O-acetylase OafA/YrhL